ncbi:MAG: hypothetical protein MZW92_74310, partial [Comamonadaceae bacterium]|nr:hypothetical protein [Comamonadaceae bacterium]
MTWELTPLLGGAWGTTQAFVPGLEASLAWRQIDFYVEAEYVRSRRDAGEDYTYAWSERWAGGLIQWLRCRAGRPAHQHLRWRSQFPARSVCASQVLSIPFVVVCLTLAIRN